MRISSLLVCSVLFFSHPTFAAPPAQWLGLFDWDLISWLDNPNRMQEICPDNNADCVKQAEEPKTLTVKVYKEPKADDANLTGTLVIIAIPGKGLFHAFKPVGKDAQTFKPDLYQEEWHYGPYYHQTIQELKGDWIKLPAKPFPHPVWLESKPFIGKRGLISEKIAPSTVYELDGKGVVITELGADKIKLRPEQPADMPCDGEAEPLKKGTEKSASYDILFDKDGHLKLKIKYPAGC